MKYDAQRTLHLAAQFTEPRPPGSTGEQAAIDALAAELAGSGWIIERNSVLGRARRVFLTQVVQAAMVLAFPAIATNGIRWAAFALAMAMLILMGLRRGFALHQKTPRAVAGVFAVAAERLSGPSVVVMTRVAPPHSVSGDWKRGVLVGLVAVAAIFTQIIGIERGPSPLLWIAWSITAAGLVALAFDHRPRPGAAGLDDNRTGLALLAELARIWPKSARGRVNVGFLVVGGPHNSRIVVPGGLPGPVLLIEIANPGRGHQVAISGTSAARELASKAATDLWTPHVEVASVPASLRDRNASRLLLRGIGKPDDPAASGRAAQLVIEIALRWGKAVTSAETR
jgi:hypothetical protein